MKTVLSILLHLIVFAGTAALWELVAVLMHRYVMHGIGWFFHEDHHKTSGRRFQKNDAYALFFALCSFLLIYFGLKNRLSLVATSGFGVAAYGLGYVLFHEIMFHKRFRHLRIPVKGPYLERIIASHRIHHSVVTKEGATNFGFLYAGKAPEDS